MQLALPRRCFSPRLCNFTQRLSGCKGTSNEFMHAFWLQPDLQVESPFCVFQFDASSLLGGTGFGSKIVSKKAAAAVCAEPQHATAAEECYRSQPSRAREIPSLRAHLAPV